MRKRQGQSLKDRFRYVGNSTQKNNSNIQNLKSERDLHPLLYNGILICVVRHKQQPMMCSVPVTTTVFIKMGYILIRSLDLYPTCIFADSTNTYPDWQTFTLPSRISLSFMFSISKSKQIITLGKLVSQCSGDISLRVTFGENFGFRVLPPQNAFLTVLPSFQNYGSLALSFLVKVVSPKANEATEPFY